MLNAMRDRATGLTAKIILGLLIASFAVWGIEDVFRSNLRQAEVAKVGKVVITRAQLEQDMQRDIEDLRSRLGANYKPEIIAMLNLPMQVAARLVTASLFAQESRELGLIPSDEAVAQTIRDNMAFQDEKGNFSKQHYLQALRQIGMSERDFVAGIKRDMASQLLRQTIASRGVIPDSAIATLLAAQNETREVEIYSVPVQASVTEPTDDELDAFYKDISDRYAIPEYRKVSYVTVAGQDKANQLDDLLAGGSSLQEASKEMGLTIEATTFFDAKGLSPDGKKVSLPELNRFADTSFSTDAKTSSAAVSGKPGTFYVVHVDEVKPESVKPLAEVRKEVVSAYKDSRQLQSAQTKLKEITAQLQDEKTRAATVAKFNLLTKGKVTRTSTTLGNINLTDALKSSLFAAPVKDFTPIQALNESSFVVAKVLASDFPKTLTKVLDSKEAKDLRNSLEIQQQQERLEQYQTYLFKKYDVRINEAMLSEIANSYGEK